MSTNINVRVDAELRDEARKVLSALGLDMSTAITLFLNATIRENGLPFDLRLKPNARLTSAMDEALQLEGDPSAKRFHSMQDLIHDLQSDED